MVDGSEVTPIVDREWQKKDLIVQDELKTCSRTFGRDLPTVHLFLAISDCGDAVWQFITGTNKNYTFCNYLVDLVDHLDNHHDYWGNEQNYS